MKPERELPQGISDAVEGITSQKLINPTGKSLYPKYRSIKELCIKNKLEKHYHYIIKETQNGRELSDILKSISNVPKKSDLYRFVIRGVEYKSCLDFCRKNDLVAHYGVMRHDLRKGASPEAAFMHAMEIKYKKQ